MIPRRLVRTVPEVTSPTVEDYWTRWIELHPDWSHITFRDPIDPGQFPLTARYWDACTSGAQRAGLIRLEALAHGGGVYVDSDVEPYRPLDPLLGLHGFAAWEDSRVVPDAVLGFEAAHPAVLACLGLALERLDQGAWASGPGVTTELLPGRDDVLLLPPGSFYTYHYSRKDRDRDRDHKTEQPWAFASHHWHASWLPPEEPRSRSAYPGRRATRQPR